MVILYGEVFWEVLYTYYVTTILLQKSCVNKNIYGTLVGVSFVLLGDFGNGIPSTVTLWQYGPFKK